MSSSSDFKEDRKWKRVRLQENTLKFIFFLKRRPGLRGHTTRRERNEEFNPNTCFIRMNLSTLIQLNAN